MAGAPSELPAQCASCIRVCRRAYVCVAALVVKERLAIPASKGTCGQHGPCSYLLPRAGVFSLPRTAGCSVLPCISQVLDTCTSPMRSWQGECRRASLMAEVSSLKEQEDSGFDWVPAFLGMLTHALDRQCGATKAEQASPARWEWVGRSRSTQALSKLQRSHHPAVRVHGVVSGTHKALAVTACPLGAGTGWGWHRVGRGAWSLPLTCFSAPGQGETPHRGAARGKLCNLG